MSTFNRPNLPTDPRRPWVPQPSSWWERLPILYSLAQASSVWWVAILENLASKWAHPGKLGIKCCL